MTGFAGQAEEAQKVAQVALVLAMSVKGGVAAVGL